MPEDKDKNAAWTNVQNGHIFINKELTEKDVRQILKARNLKKVHFGSKPSSKTLELLNQYLFSERPDVWLHPSGFAEFEFLKSISNLEALHIANFGIKSFDGIENLFRLKKLILYDTKSNSISLKPISKLYQLESLYISGHTKDIDSIAGLTKIKELTLRRVSLQNLDFLKNYEQLQELHVILGGTKNYSAIGALPKLKIFELWQVQNLADIEFISGLKALEFLQITSLKNIKKLPRFTYNHKLTKVVFENLKGIDNVATLKNLQNLEEFWFIAANNLTPEHFRVLKDCPKLKMASVGFGSQRKNDELQAFFTKHGIGKYDSKKSKFQ